MAYFPTHSHLPRAKIEGFMNPPSPTTFDPSIYFSGGPMFPDTLRNPSNLNGQGDFDAFWSSLPGGDHHSNAGKQGSPKPPHQPQSGMQHQQLQQHQPMQQQHGRSASLNLNIPQAVYDMSHFPSLTSSLGQSQHQHHRTPRDDALDSPASVHLSQSLFPSDNNAGQVNGRNHFAGAGIPGFMNSKADTPPSIMGASPSDSPSFPTHVSHAKMHAHRSPSMGPVSHSRSRSRGGNTSRPPPASRNSHTVGKASREQKRPSLSTTPDDSSGMLMSPPLSSARSNSVLNPGTMNSNPSHHPHQLSHEYTAHQMNALGPHPISPLGLHSTQTTPSWFMPNSSQSRSNAVPQRASDAFNIGGSGNDNEIVTSFSAFQPRSLSLGSGPKPGTSASASVLAGNIHPAGLDSPIDDREKLLPTDAASRQAALLHEKRRRRRESHNAVERRRRDNINEKITELSTLLPDCLLEGGSPSIDALIPNADGTTPTMTTTGPLAPEGDEKETPAMKANKGIVLRKSVEYIRYLQQLVRAQAERNKALESELAIYKPEAAASSDDAMRMVDAADPLSISMLMSVPVETEDDMMCITGMAFSPDDSTAPTTAAMRGERRGSGNETQLPRIGEDNSEEDEEEERGRAVIRGNRRGGVAGPNGVKKSDSAERGESFEISEERMIDE